MRTLILQALKKFIPLAIAISLVSLMIYGVSQQEFRQTANDPQVQVAENIASAWAKGVQPEGLLTSGDTEMATTSGVFAILYDLSKKPLLASVKLNSKVPTIPAGVLDQAKEEGEYRVTWQPGPTLREATVVRYVADKGYVVVGRSLAETERRIDHIGMLVTLGWIGTLLLSFVGSLIFGFIGWWRNRTHEDTPIHREL
jgi:hypothetical protein